MRHLSFPGAELAADIVMQAASGSDCVRKYRMEVLSLFHYSRNRLCLLLTVLVP